MAVFGLPDPAPPVPPAAEPEPAPSRVSGFRILCARLLIGWIVLICAEVFSGASLRPGLWSPWTILLTYWLYFAHFFFFTTLAVRTGRTSLSALYLWGVLFGLYESWITKVIWSGYDGGGKFAMGRIGPYGFSEISMVFFFHPLVSFLLPLAIGCLLFPPLRRSFPDLARFTGKSAAARIAQIYATIAFAAILGMNSGGPLNLALNLGFALMVLFLLLRLAQPARSGSDGSPVFVFGRRGFPALCVYLALLYGVSYFAIRPEGLPSAGVQLLTFVFYALAIAGLWMHRRRPPVGPDQAAVESREGRLIVQLFAAVLILGFAVSVFGLNPVLEVFILLTFILWTFSGFGFALAALARAIRESAGKFRTATESPASKR